jgi:prephenate dehydrogenase
MLEISQVTVIGTGLLGASLGLGLRAAGYRGRIVGVGRRLETVERARQRGGVDQAFSLDELAQALPPDGLAILATPISAFAGLLENIARAAPPSLIVTDVGSTKQEVCALARRVLAGRARFVGSHPMAGSERHGPDHASADLFHQKPCIITAEPDSDPGAVTAVESLWTTLGMKIIRLSPGEHDARAALVSHLPHALAAVLVQLASRHGGLDIASTGFRSTTRVAGGDPAVWGDIFATNREAVAHAIELLIQDLSQFRATLLEDRDENILRLLEDSRATREKWLHHGLGQDEQ